MQSFLRCECQHLSCHAGISRMDEVYINQEADSYVMEADGTLDLGVLQLQPGTIAINGSVTTSTPGCWQDLSN